MISDLDPEFPLEAHNTDDAGSFITTALERHVNGSRLLLVGGPVFSGFNQMLRYPTLYGYPADNQIFLSAISIAELMIKHSIGQIEINFDPIELARKTGLELLDFSGADAVMLGKLPFYHKDPFDRMLIVQALVRKLCLMTEDSKFMRYGCKII